ncbi:MAG: NUDIX domain-containing protein, partial [Lactobacillus sp.]|nr:NUDIX domain-containing protein [Lactobacillus sp.]
MKETASLWLMNKSGEFLLQFRSPNMRNNPNTWGNGAGGGIDAGETSLDAIVRETREELGLEIPPQDFVFLGEFFDTSNPDREKHLWLYFAQGDWKISDIKIQESEITKVKFATLSEIKEMIGTPI